MGRILKGKIMNAIINGSASAGSGRLRLDVGTLTVLALAAGQSSSFTTTLTTVKSQQLDAVRFQSDASVSGTIDVDNTGGTDDLKITYNPTTGGGPLQNLGTVPAGGVLNGVAWSFAHMDDTLYVEKA